MHFTIFQNLLVRDATKRMSIKGILRWTEGTCRPEVPRNEGNSILLFNQIDIEKVCRMALAKRAFFGRTINEVKNAQHRLEKLESTKELAFCDDV